MNESVGLYGELDWKDRIWMPKGCVAMITGKEPYLPAGAVQ